MTNAFRISAMTALLAWQAVRADLVSGKVTDLATREPLAGVRVAAGTAQTLTAADGSYSLNTAATGFAADRDPPAVEWDAAAGAFAWDARHGEVRIEVRDIRGRMLERSADRASGPARYRLGEGSQGLLLVTVRSGAGAYVFRINRIGNLALLLKEEEAPGRAAVRALVKMAAVNKIGFTLAGYDAFTQNVDGNQASFDVSLNRAGSLAWRQARLTWYESYPDPGSEECVKYNGCAWAGQFAALGKKPLEWVKENNLVAVHSKDYEQYKLKTLRLKYREWQIDAQVVDLCSDSDCEGCCTQNAQTGGGFLIDLEVHGARRFGIGDGAIEWACLDCT